MEYLSLLWSPFAIPVYIGVALIYGNKNFHRLIGRRARHGLASKGWWKYEGLRGFHPTHWPMGYVIYPDGGRTVNMALGNAHDYRKMFGGTVHDA